MQLNFPSDIRAEIVGNYFEGLNKEIAFLGSHKRNAYEDILSLSNDDDGVKIELSRPGLYDILPEALFHPIDRFDSIPPNEYKERFSEEVERQRMEESSARAFFSLFESFIFDLSSIVASFKDSEYNDCKVLTDIICDSLPEIYKSNRFVCRAKKFTVRSNCIRGNKTLVSLMIRKIMADEGLKLVEICNPEIFEDNNPRYNCCLRDDDEYSDLYLGNIFEEDVLRYEVQFWNDDFCDESFLRFVDDIKVFEDFINDWFIGIEASVRFHISTQTFPVRLSDDLCHNYLNYNTNL